MADFTTQATTFNEKMGQMLMRGGTVTFNTNTGDIQTGLNNVYAADVICGADDAQNLSLSFSSGVITVVEGVNADDTGNWWALGT